MATTMLIVNIINSSNYDDMSMRDLQCQ